MSRGGDYMVDSADWPIIGMTVEETAEALRVDVKTVRRLIKDGSIPARKVGVGWRVEPEAVKEWLRQGTPQAELDD
jgi:excisionase family DNA binding protein